jgi:hypothetical protein
MEPLVRGQLDICVPVLSVKLHWWSGEVIKYATYAYTVERYDDSTFFDFKRKVFSPPKAPCAHEEEFATRVVAAGPMNKVVEGYRVFAKACFEHAEPGVGYIVRIYDIDQGTLVHELPMVGTTPFGIPVSRDRGRLVVHHFRGRKRR